MLVLFFWLLQRFLPGGALDAHQGTNASKHLWRDALVILVIPSLLAVILLAFPKLVSKSPIVGRALLLETMPLLGICLLVWKHARAFRHPRLVVYTLVAVWLALMVVSESHKLRDSWSPAQGMITAAFGVPAGTMLLLEVGSDGELMHLMSPMIDQGEFERTMAGRRAILPFRLAWVALESSRWIAAPLPLLIILALGMATYRRRGRLAAFALSVPVVLLCLYVEGISISTAGYTNQTSINARPLPRGATVFSLLLVGVMLCLSAPRQEVVPPISPRVRRRLAWAALFLLPGLAVVLFLPAAIARRQDQALEEFRVQAGSSPGANRIRDDIYRAFAIKAGNAGVRKGWANFNTMVNSLQHARNSKTAAPGESEQVIAIWRKGFPRRDGGDRGSGGLGGKGGRGTDRCKEAAGGGVLEPGSAGAVCPRGGKGPGLRGRAARERGADRRCGRRAQQVLEDFAPLPVHWCLGMESHALGLRRRCGGGAQQGTGKSGESDGREVG
jgi:hypothetical protein